MAGWLGVAAALGALVLAVDRYLLGGRGGGGRPLVRLVGRVVTYAGLGGLAFALLSFPPAVVVVGMVVFGGAGGWLGATLEALRPAGWDEGQRDRIEGGAAEVIDEVTRGRGRVLVVDGGDRWYLAARPFRGGRYEAGVEVVVVSVRDGVALVASREEVGR